jgi:putative membrane protein
MIRGYRDHVANERTFLAWVRTGIAVIAFGFVIEKFSLFVLTVASVSSLDAGRRAHLMHRMRRATSAHGTGA